MDATQLRVYTGVHKVLPNSLVMAIAAVVALLAIPLILWAVFNFWIQALWPLYGALVGLLWSVVFSIFVVMRLSAGVRAGGAGFGAAFGIQTVYDWFEETDVPSKLGLIEQIVMKVLERIGGKTDTLEPTVVAGVWTFVIALALILAFSMLGTKPAQPAGPMPPGPAPAGPDPEE